MIKKYVNFIVIIIFWFWVFLFFDFLLGYIYRENKEVIDIMVLKG